MNDKISECIGLWLAEGDNKSLYEITFTNNCFKLILHFHKTVGKIMKLDATKIRIYSYSRNKDEIMTIPFPVKRTRHYIDTRARKPYFIWRYASKTKVAQWKTLVKQMCSKKENFPHILRGFFAGEGNIKTGSHSNRTLRIAQKESNKYTEKILRELKIDHKFRKKDRAYYIHHKSNWDIFSRHKLADLHPEKKTKFWQTYREFKQDHYKNHHIRDQIMKKIKSPHTPQKSWPYILIEVKRMFVKF